MNTRNVKFDNSTTKQEKSFLPLNQINTIIFAVTWQIFPMHAIHMSIAFLMICFMHDEIKFVNQ
jgi:hypothetical protein